MFVQEESKLCPERCRQGLLVVRIAQIHHLPAGRIIGAGVPLAGLGLDALPGLGKIQGQLGQLPQSGQSGLRGRLGQLGL